MSDTLSTKETDEARQAFLARFSPQILAHPRVFPLREEDTFMLVGPYDEEMYFLEQVAKAVGSRRFWVRRLREVVLNAAGRPTVYVRLILEPKEGESSENA